VKKHGSGQVITVNYTERDHPVQTYKAALQMAVRQAGAPRGPLEGPLRLLVGFYLPRPAKLMRKKDPNGPVPHTAKPDVDNLLKSTKDALNGLVWRDDSQICAVEAHKWYAGQSELPRVELVLYSL
jgi:Holliday junction resolvase RusA-like endonuclease